jgi:hypothetical protein
MAGGLFLWSEDFCNLVVSPFGDVVILGLHAVYPALDLISVIFDQEDNAVEILPDYSRKLLSRELE